MRVTVAAVGRLKPGPVRDLVTLYVKRLAWPIAFREVEARGSRADREAEAALLLATLPAGCVVIALDERGEDLPSEAIARRIGTWRDDGRSELAFLIGGADGHGEAVRARADLLLAFGRATWPHMLVRAMLVEQIYRAQTILTGHPYHRS